METTDKKCVLSWGKATTEKAKLNECSNMCTALRMRMEVIVRNYVRLNRIFDDSEQKTLKVNEMAKDLLDIMTDVTDLSRKIDTIHLKEQDD